MSVTEVMARVEELRALIEGRVGSTGGTPAPADANAFASQLAASQAALGGPAPAATAAAAPGGGDVPFAAQIDAAAQRYALDPALLRGLIAQESNFNPAARSPAGATGLTQLMPGTAAALGVDPSDPAQAIDGGAKYLRQQLDRFGGDVRLGLAAYNAGPGAVSRFGGIPPYAETQRYVEAVLGRAESYRSAVSSVPYSGGGLPYSTT